MNRPTQTIGDQQFTCNTETNADNAKIFDLVICARVPKKMSAGDKKKNKEAEDLIARGQEAKIIASTHLIEVDRLVLYCALSLAQLQEYCTNYFEDNSEALAAAAASL